MCWARRTKRNVDMDGWPRATSNPRISSLLWYTLISLKNKMSVIPRKLLLLILVSLGKISTIINYKSQSNLSFLQSDIKWVNVCWIALVCVLFILLYGGQLQRKDYIYPSAQASPVTAGKQETCPNVVSYPADIETSNVFPSLDLTPSWMSRREFWGNEYEDRYVRRKSMWSQLPLRLVAIK